MAPAYCTFQQKLNFLTASQACASIGAHQLILRTEYDRELILEFLTGNYYNLFTIL